MKHPKPILDYRQPGRDQRGMLDRMDKVLTVVLGSVLVLTLLIVVLTWIMLLAFG